MQNDFTAVFWNTWFELQDGTRDDSTQVCKRLQALIDTHSPDVFGLNEVYFKSAGHKSPLVELLQHNGYHTHFTAHTIGDKDQLIGNLFACKQKPVSVIDRPFGQDATSHIRWYKDYSPKVIEATLQIGDETVMFLVVHLCVMVPSDILTHIRHRLRYNRLVSNYDTKNLIIGGDFNELKYMPPWLHIPAGFRRATGSFLNQTWLLNGKQTGILRGNMDNIVYSTTGSLQMTDFEVLERFPSDHTPLLARFRLG